ncbi:hypothetical protein BDZ94DRAFT_50409 [Collybia nuda]|uniref:DNA mismatch repair protein PMS1 n=1 Tax=Collybia nuda TaxID=64659 RepID=A0A9P5YG58_9AGAR|nr:hypothetical protein BDZ94DRAFT_50409 [Collybia nuda]
MAEKGAIKPIDKSSVHRITSGQVVIDLQTAVKELVENSLDAGATNIEVRFKQYGLKSIEVIDNGSGIAEEYHDSIALKHHTSKLTSFSDLATVRTFGFRGEALSSLCGLSEMVTVVTATAPPLGMSLEMEPSGKVHRRSKVARQRGTTVIVSNLFLPLPVRRKELDRNSKREFGKALSLLNAYALGPCCCSGAGVRLTVSNQVDKGQKSVQLRTAGASSARDAVSALWGPKVLDNLVGLDLSFDVDRDKVALKRTMASTEDLEAVPVVVKGLVSKFSVGGGRTGTDRQFFYVNGRPCNLTKIQKAFNEVYRSFNANQAPFILADFIIPTDSCDINVSPDKRTIFVHSEGNLITKLKAVLEESFAPSRSTYDVEAGSQRMTQSTLPVRPATRGRASANSGLTVGSARNVDTNIVAEKPDDASSVPSSSPLEAQLGSDSQSSTNALPEAITPPSELSTSQTNHPRSPDEAHSSSPSHLEVPSLAESDLSRDQMDVDEGADSQSAAPRPSILRTQSAGDRQAVTITVDTSSASWNRHSQLSISNSGDINRGVGDAEEEEEEEEEEREDHRPARKKRKSEIGTVLGIGGRGSGNKSQSRTVSREQDVGNLKRKRGPSEKSTTKDVRGQLRNRLVEFARIGSQITHAQQDDEEEEEDELDELMSSEPCTAPLDAEQETPHITHKVAESDDAANTSPGVVSGTPSPLPNNLNDNTDAPLAGQSSSSAIDLASDEDGDPGASVRNLTEQTSSALHREATKAVEVARSTDTSSGDVTLRFDLNRVTSTWTRKDNKLRPDLDLGTTLSLVPSDAGVTNIEDNDKAADALARVIDKSDFADMEVLGQFNLGFIVARRRKAVVRSEAGSQGTETGGAATMMDDLFIVDQHAADEKYNFETLQQTTNIQCQKLFRPQEMELTASDELLAIENIDILRQNGFEIEIGVEVDCQSGSRLKLTAQPVSKSTVFDMKDLEELIHLMRDSPSGQMVRCSKARAMFAMRACRKSVMVGMPLNRQQMALVVQHMGTMDQPWNCPHGRPTMRHLFDLSNTRSHNPFNPIDWSAFSTE